MKKSTRIRCVIAIIACVGVWIGYIENTLSYSEVKAGCEFAISEDSPVDSLEAWLQEKDIDYLKTDYPLSLEKRYSVDGIESEIVQSKVHTLEFQVEVRGGLLSAHIVYGTFTFSRDGSYYEHTIDDTYYGIL